MSDKEQLYRVREKGGRPYVCKLQTLNELSKCYFARVQLKQPEPPFPIVQLRSWYCHNTACDVRQIDTTAKYEDGGAPTKPPKYKCPACGKPLMFVGCFKEVTLEPVED